MKMEDMVLVSLDDHIIEPPDMYERHLTAEQKKFAPTFHTDKEGINYWLYDGRRIGGVGLNAVVGRPKVEYGMEPVSLSQMREGCYNVAKRVDDMNVNGVLASMCFPTVTMFDGNVFNTFKDKKQALTLLRAYNDWHVDEWCAAAPGRFIPCCLVPSWDMNATVDEIKRLAKKGVHSVTFSDNPVNRGYPSIHNEYWEPFWKVCAENEVVIGMHHGTGNAAPRFSPESPMDAWIVCMGLSISLALTDYLHLDALLRYKNLKFALIESGVGWIPYVLERMDFVLQQHGTWTHSNFGGKKASDIFREHFLCTFVHRDGGFNQEAIALLGAHTICYESDYPHSDTQWPRGPEALWEYIGKLPDKQIDMMTHENALKAYAFDAFGKLGGRENCTVKALRTKAAHVDTTEHSKPGFSATAGTGSRGRVTTADVEAFFKRLEEKHASNDSSGTQAAE
ncbi:MAG: amidohydrolase [Rhodospirillaceae bacterium]|nr:MAG: amidohydrolase [Rhodospirillaceae bacterium]